MYLYEVPAETPIHTHDNPPSPDLEHGPGTVWECNCGKEWKIIQLNTGYQAERIEWPWHVNGVTFGWMSND